MLLTKLYITEVNKSVLKHLFIWAILGQDGVNLVHMWRAKLWNHLLTFLVWEATSQHDQWGRLGGKQGRRTSFLGRAAPGCSLNVGCKLLSSHLREAAAKPVLPLWGLCCLEILRRSSPDASDTLLLGSCSQEFWHRNPVLFFVCLFCYIKVGVSGCQITGFHPNTCPIDIPDPRPLLLTSPLTPTVGYQRWKEV